jgi:hypothetical protein
LFPPQAASQHVSQFMHAIYARYDFFRCGAVPVFEAAHYSGLHRAGHLRRAEGWD